MMENKANELIVNSNQVDELKSNIDGSDFPTILCTNLKPDNPNFLGIIHANDLFCQTFKVNQGELLGKDYDFLFENQETDYSSEDQIEFIKLINAIKNNEPCSITQIIKNVEDHSLTTYKIDLEPVLHEGSKNYHIFTFQKCSNDEKGNKKSIQSRGNSCFKSFKLQLSG